MKYNFTNMLLQLCLLLVVQSCKNASYMVKPEASYEQLAPRKSFIDAGGNVHFVAFGKGPNKENCLKNASYLLLRHIIYNGIENGTEMKPLIGSGEFANAFRENESTYINLMLNGTNILSTDGKVRDKIATSKIKRESMYQMSFDITVNMLILKEEFNRIKNQNP